MFTRVETELAAQMNPELSRSPGTRAEQQLLPGESTLIQAIKRLRYMRNRSNPFRRQHAIPSLISRDYWPAKSRQLMRAWSTITGSNRLPIEERIKKRK